MHSTVLFILAAFLGSQVFSGQAADVFWNFPPAELLSPYWHDENNWEGLTLPSPDDDVYLLNSLNSSCGAYLAALAYFEYAPYQTLPVTTDTTTTLTSTSSTTTFSSPFQILLPPSFAIKSLVVDANVSLDIVGVTLVVTGMHLLLPTVCFPPVLTTSM